MRKNAAKALRDTARAAQFFGVPEPTIRRWRSQGLPASREARFAEWLEHTAEVKKPPVKQLLSNTKEVAEFFGVPEPTVRRWRSQGFPEGRAEQLQRFRAVETERTDFRDLLKLVKAKDELPDVKSFEKARDGRYTVGSERQEALETWLTPQVVAQVVELLRSWTFPRPSPPTGETEDRPGFNSGRVRWIATARVSEFGPPAEARVAGYQAIIVPSLKHSKAAQVNFAGVHTSGAQTTKAEAIGVLTGELRDLTQTPGLVLWIHSVYLSLYRHKTQFEITSGETAKRKARGYNKR